MSELQNPDMDIPNMVQLLDVCNAIILSANDQYQIMKQNQKPTKEGNELDRHTLYHLNKVTNCIEHEIVPRAKQISCVSHLFDFDNVPANGYRSFLIVTERCCVALLESLRSLSKNPLVRLTATLSIGYIDCRRTFVCYCQCLYEIAGCLQLLVRLSKLAIEYHDNKLQQSSPHVICDQDNDGTGGATARAGTIPMSSSARVTKYPLFLSKEVQSSPQISTFVDSMDDVNQEVFYGRCVGFQYSQSIKPIMAGMTTMMASYVMQYNDQPNQPMDAASLVFPALAHANQSKPGFSGSSVPISNICTNLMDPDKRGRRLAFVTRHAPVQFCKQFWNLLNSKVALHAPLLVAPAAAVAYNFSIPVRDFTVHIGQGEERRAFSPPNPGGNVNAVRLRILCTRMREELRWCCTKNSRTNKFESPPIINGHVIHECPPVRVPSEPPTPDDCECKSVFEPISSANSEPDSTPEVKPASGFFATNYVFENIKQLFTGFVSHPNVVPAKRILFHCHGGGFVGQCAQAHDVYLRFWAEYLDCIIISVEYSKAPEYPFPQAVDEAFYAYCWMLKYAAKYICPNLESIVLAGDSAGGNLVLGVMQRILQYDVTPRPTGIFLAYTPVLIDFSVSPARMLSVMDDLLPLGIMSRCLLAYAGVDESRLIQEYEIRAINEEIRASDILAEEYEKSFESEERHITMKTLEEFVVLPHGVPPSPLTILRKANLPTNPVMSPFLMSDCNLKRFPPVVIMGCHLDPLLDDCVEFAKRLQSVNVPITLRVLEGLPHGFLNFILLNPECRAASDECLKYIERLFQGI